MANKSRNKKNQPPTGEGKKQSPRSGAANKLDKRSEVAQAQHDRPDLNVGSAGDEAAATSELSEEARNPGRAKAGR
ncbi:MAG TPA: hypothetical protein VE842_06480 [Pyrinomonadaceae bacterium]|jgi:hypothetical protein|nr:hypothetical protein [Pyrinomonadaceae bacterium]